MGGVRSNASPFIGGGEPTDRPRPAVALVLGRRPTEISVSATTITMLPNEGVRRPLCV